MISTREQKQRVQKHFDADAGWKGALYDAPCDRFRRAVSRRKLYSMDMLQNLDLKDMMVMDVGCGSGVYLQELLGSGARCFGMDFSFGMAREAHSRLRGTNSGSRVMCADVESIPLKSERFDVALCVGVLGYLAGDTGAIKEIHRILRPGGFLLLSVENMMSLSNIDSIWRRRIASLFRRNHRTNGPSGGVSTVSPWVYRHSSTHYAYRLYNPWKLEAIMNSFGFILVDSLTHGFEFRVLRKLKLLPESLSERLEIFLENFFKETRLPYFSYSGESYTGLFRKLDRSVL